MSCTRLETQGIKLGTVSPKVGVDFGAMSEIIGNRAVNLLKRQRVIVIGDTLRRKKVFRRSKVITCVIILSGAMILVIVVRAGWR